MSNILKRLFSDPIPKWAERAINVAKRDKLRTLIMREEDWELNPIGSRLREIPLELFDLTWLVELDISEHPLTKIPQDMGKLIHLRKLSLRSNELEVIPESISQLTKLQELDLRYNQLRTIPESIKHLADLRKLSLEGNSLEIIPESIGQLMVLQELNLGYNQLNTLPESIKSLANLRKLFLHKNSLVNVPAWFIELPNLRELTLYENPIVTPPPEILRSYGNHLVDINNLHAYFRQLAEQGSDHLFEAKLLVVGEPGAGKTSLTHKIINPNYQLIPDEVSTEGIDVFTWEFEFDWKRNENVNKEKFRVNIWDFGGQAIYHATHQFFLTRRSLYIVVADAREQKADFFHWLDIIEHLSDNSPVLILSNEKQDRQWQINERQLRRHFTNLKENVFTANLQTNRGLDRLRQAIRYYLTHLPHVGDILPQTWVNVRRTLERDERPYISLQQYLDLCEQHGFTRSDDKLQLGNYLHDLGVILHFQDDPVLRKTIILKPEWGTDAVYRVLDNDKVIENFGQFTRADLKEIWHEEQYALMHDDLLALMMKFELCYEIPERPGNYIAPQLLSEKQPAYKWKTDDNLNLRYKYEEFMPHGLLTRFIVALHPYIAKRSRQSIVWRSGVGLVKDNTAAEVIEYYPRREIHIRVVGTHKRDLLTTIVYELDRLHRPFHRLKYDKLIPCNCATCSQEEDPYFFQLDILKTRLAHGKKSIECDRPPFHSVNISSLIDDVGEQVFETSQEPIRVSPLLQNLLETFDEQEMRTLCFRLHLDYDDLPAQGRSNKARELILRMKRRGQLADLVEILKQERPNSF